MRHVKYIIVALVILLVILLVFAIQDYRSLRRAQIINAHQLWIANVLKNHSSLNASDVGIIRPWMTFDYINRLFNLPPAYLKNSLSISDPQYPAISLSGYAKYGHLDVTLLINNISGAIRNYPTSTSI